MSPALTDGHPSAAPPEQSRAPPTPPSFFNSAFWGSAASCCGLCCSPCTWREWLKGPGATPPPRGTPAEPGDGSLPHPGRVGASAAGSGPCWLVPPCHLLRVLTVSLCHATLRLLPLPVGLVVELLGPLAAREEAESVVPSVAKPRCRQSATLLGEQNQRMPRTDIATACSFFQCQP